MIWNRASGVTSGGGLMLGRREKDQPTLVIRKSEGDRARQIIEWNDFSLGMGLQFGEPEDHRYHFALACDASIGGQVQQGPLITTITPATVDSTNGISHFFEIDGSLYALNGRYVLVRAESQTITESGTPTGGTFTMTFGGNTTSALAFDVSAADMQTALRLLAGLESVTVTRTGASNYVWTIVMRGAGDNPAQFTTTDSLTGGSSPATTPATSATQDQSGAWTVDKDFGSGKIATDVVVTKLNSAGSTEYAYIGVGGESGTANLPFYRFDGTTYTEHATLYALALCIVGRELYRAQDTNLIAKVDTNSDPWTAGNWTAANQFRIGDFKSAITRMVVNAAGVLVIFKTDGIYALDENGQDIQLYSDLKFLPDATNGKYHFKFENWIHVTYSGRHFRIAPDLSIEPIGPERYAELSGVTVTGAVYGTITAGIGTPFAAYAGLYDPDGDDAYLLKFGAWAPRSGYDPERIDAWHGSISPKYLNKTITAMWRSARGAASAHERVYIGWDDGQIGWFLLPCVPNPDGCTNYVYNAIDGAVNDTCYIELPISRLRQAYSVKYPVSATLLGANIHSTRPMQLQYRFAFDRGFNALADTFVDKPGAREEFSIGVWGSIAQFHVAMTGTATTSPKLHSLTLEYFDRPPKEMIYEFSVLCEDGLFRNDGVPIRRGADSFRAGLTAFASGHTGGDSASMSARCILPPDGDIQNLALLGWEEGMAWDDRTHQWHSAIHVTALQTRPDFDNDIGDLVGTETYVVHPT